MVKIYVVDTNVLIQAPYGMQCFEDNQVVLPVVVLEELDNLKKAEGETGANVRTTIRMLEELRLQGDLLEGVTLPGGGTLRVEKNYRDVELPSDLPETKSDNRILKVCLGLSQEKPEQVVLVTKDILLRIKAQIIGIKAEDFLTEQVLGHDAQYRGRICVYAPEENFKDFKKKGIPVETIYQVDEEGKTVIPQLYENEFVIIQSDQSTKKTQLGRVEHGVIRKLEYRKAQPYGVSPRNAGQYFLQEALMQPAEKAPLVIVKGMAGTSIGPLMRRIIDNLEQLIDSNEQSRYENEAELQDKVEEVFDRGIIQAEAMNFIRGRSIVKTYLIIDEAQNMTPNQMKGLITRVGKDTKIILLGDPNQIDRPFLDERTNGLSYAAEHMKGSPLCWQITLTAEECERSKLAADAITRM